MALPTALLVKGLAGVGVVAGVVGGGFLIKELLKSKDPNEIIKSLGITGCQLENNQSKTKECELDATKVKAINFTNKTGSDQTVSGLDTNKKLNLVIEKGYQDSDFPSGLRFIFKNPKESGDITIGSGSNQITLKPGVSYDFKIKDGTKLEKAWTLKSLAEKVGLSCADDNASSCTIKSEGINVWKDQSNYVLGATVASGSNSSVTVTKDTKDHNGGFKFTVTTDTTINQSDNSKKAGTVDKLTQADKSYGIDVENIGGTKTWFLIEKSTTGG